MGYKIAVLRQGELLPDVDLQIPTGEYLGWARSTNILAREVLRLDKWANTIIGGGDDYEPIPDVHPGQIAAECWIEFERRGGTATYGVMQPTGDRWGDSESARATYGEDRGAEIDRICGSPWMGREWCERSYQGNGPMCAEYFHLYADEELCEVAKQQGVLWQRRDLLQLHNHPCRTQGYGVYHEGHLKPLYAPDAWAREQAIFEDRKRKGFPGSDPI